MNPNPIEKKIADQLGAMTLELLKLQTMIEDRDREIAELKAALNGSAAAPH
jgi:hypothetical protein